MFRCTSYFTALILSLLSFNAHADKYSNVGRIATAEEIKAWDIDVRPDFKGLPVGSGSVVMGQQVWEEKCASCHGSFGESNEVFTPIVGGTTKEDVATGRVAALVGNRQPQRTAVMKLATLSTLWDYINRAMPWTSPKSLTANEVYAVTAYILNLAEIIPENFTLSDKNIAEVQKLMPNRNGMTQKHGLGKIDGKPDVKSTICMSNCETQTKISSFLPDSAKNAHGNIHQQNRTFGSVRGVDTSAVPTSSIPANTVSKITLDVSVAANDNSSIQGKQLKPDMLSLAKKRGCLSCHGTNNKVVGPSFTEIYSKYKSDTSAEIGLIEKVKKGGSGSWGSIPMPAQPEISNGDIQLLVDWILKKSK